MNSVDKSINSVLEKIIMDIMEYDGMNRPGFSGGFIS